MSDHNQSTAALLAERQRIDELLRSRAGSPHTDFAAIAGHECAKRALTVAIAGGHSILLVGQHGCGKTMLRDAAAGLGFCLSAESTPCACGNFNDPYTPCHCEADDIGAHRAAEWPSVDIWVEVPRVSARELESHSRRPGTTSADIQKQIDRAGARPNHKLCPAGDNLLTAATRELPLNARQRETVLRVAATIAALDCSPRIEIQHLCEAINYRTPTR